MRPIASLVAGAVFVLGLTFCGERGIPEPMVDRPLGGSWQLTFRDEFDGAALGTAWSTCHWWQTDGGCTIASNDEQQWYRPEAIAVKDGSLHLTASSDPQRTTDGRMLPYRSGMVTTGFTDADEPDPGFVFTYGYVEARVRLPAGAGVWPAVWLLSADRTSLPEIDVMEWYGSKPDVIKGVVHQRVGGERSSARVEVSEPDMSGEWHVVGALWEPTEVVFFLDGKESGRVTDPALVPSTPMYLILNLALGGPAGAVDPASLPQSFLVDHVRVWQRAGAVG